MYFKIFQMALRQKSVSGRFRQYTWKRGWRHLHGNRNRILGVTSSSRSEHMVNQLWPPRGWGHVEQHRRRNVPYPAKTGGGRCIRALNFVSSRLIVIQTLDSNLLITLENINICMYRRNFYWVGRISFLLIFFGKCNLYLSTTFYLSVMIKKFS